MVYYQIEDILNGIDDDYLTIEMQPKWRRNFMGLENAHDLGEDEIHHCEASWGSRVAVLKLYRSSYFHHFINTAMISEKLFWLKSVKKAFESNVIVLESQTWIEPG